MSADQDGRGVPVPIVVTGCDDCEPFMCIEALDGAGFCCHPEAPTNNETASVWPNECPLRSNPALVVLRTEVVSDEV